LVLVSLATAPPPYDKVAGLTYALADAPTAKRADAQTTDQPGPAAYLSDPRWHRKDAWLSVVLVLCVGLIWWYFS
jgi:hypothetical protein